MAPRPGETKRHRQRGERGGWRMLPPARDDPARLRQQGAGARILGLLLLSLLLPVRDSPYSHLGTLRSAAQERDVLRGLACNARREERLRLGRPVPAETEFKWARREVASVRCDRGRSGSSPGVSQHELTRGPRGLTGVFSALDSWGPMPPPTRPQARAHPLFSRPYSATPCDLTHLAQSPEESRSPR